MQPFNRRLFLTGALTAAIVAATSTGILVLPSDGQAAPAPPLDGSWMPIRDEVAAWLETYKDSCAAIHQWAERVHLGLKVSMATETPPQEITLTDVTEEWLAEEAKFDRAWNDWQSTRYAVARAQGDGYFAGRDAQNRSLPADFKPGSIEAFAWHNGWFVGHGDLSRRANFA